MTPEIQPHALRAFKRRVKFGGSDEEAEVRILELLSGAEEMEVLPRHRACQLIRHRFEPARYYQGRGWVGGKRRCLIFVVVEDRLITVHHGEANKWQPKT